MGNRWSEVRPSTTIASDNIKMPIRLRSAKSVSHIAKWVRGEG